MVILITPQIPPAIIKAKIIIIRMIKDEVLVILFQNNITLARLNINQPTLK